MNAATAVRMRCRDLAATPRFALPPGYTLRTYRPGDEEAWADIHRLADRLNPVTATLFGEQFGARQEEPPRRQFFLLNPAAATVGTATAWFGTDRDGALLGRVHWVAIVPAEQGRGLAKPLLSAVCCRLLELGHRQAYLTTSILRPPALNLYFAFGFRPEIETAEDRAAWTALLRPVPGQAGAPLRPGLAAWLRAVAGLAPSGGLAQATGSARDR